MSSIARLSILYNSVSLTFSDGELPDDEKIMTINLQKGKFYDLLTRLACVDGVGILNYINSDKNSNIIKVDVTMLFNPDEIMVDIDDENASARILTARISPDHVLDLLSGKFVPFDGEFSNLDKLGKKLVVDTLEFEVPDGINNNMIKQWAKDTAENLCPDGWVSDGYFNSQNSFFYKYTNNKYYARVTIRKWE